MAVDVTTQHAVTVMTTGGTFDKTYGRGALVRDLHVGKPMAPEILHRMGVFPNIKITHVLICTKDSMDIDPTDRKAIVSMAGVGRAKRTLIVHGTDTMLDTARALYDAGLGHDHTIVLTGASQPACMKDSDAEFNLGLALGACLFAPPGIYVAMNGVHDWKSCTKDPKTGIFTFA